MKIVKIACWFTLISMLFIIKIIRFSNPGLTETKLFLQTWHLLIPMVVSVLILIYIIHKNNDTNRKG